MEDIEVWKIRGKPWRNNRFMCRKTILSAPNTRYKYTVGIIMTYRLLTILFPL